MPEESGVEILEKPVEASSKPQGHENSSEDKVRQETEFMDKFVNVSRLVTVYTSNRDMLKLVGQDYLDRPEYANVHKTIIANISILEQCFFQDDDYYLHYAIRHLGDLAIDEGDLKKVSVEVLRRNFDSVKKVLDSDSSEIYDKKQAVKAVFHMAKNPEIENLETYLETVGDNLGLFDKEEYFPVEYLELLLDKGSDTQKEKAKIALIANFENDEITLDRRVYNVAHLIRSKSETCSKTVTEYIDGKFKSLEQTGLDFKQLADAWNDSGSFEECAIKNMLSIIDLEGERPGIAKTLYSKFHIKDFARYPKSLLVKQFDQIGDVKKPYGILLFPQHDWNGTFYNQKETYEDLSHQLGEDYNLRVYEVGGALSAVHVLNQARKEYGKVSFAFVGGHGEPNLIEFGSADSGRGIISIGDIRRPGAKAMLEAFGKNATIVLSSCSTGAREGIGQEISKQLGIEVIGPEKPFMHMKVKVEKKSEGLGFTVVYDEASVSENKYVQGIKS